MTIQLRNLWGVGKLAQLESESRHEAEPVYETLQPVPALGLSFAERRHSSAYITWARLPELFPISFPGLKTSRDPLVIDIDRDRLEARMRMYFDPLKSHEEIAQSLPDAMEDGYMYKAREIRAELQSRGFRAWEVMRYTYRPFDLRWIYWEPETGLLRRKVEDYTAQLIGNTTWIEARQREAGDTFARGTVVNGLADNFGNGYSSFFPAEVIENSPLLGVLQIVPNLSRAAETYLDSIGADRADLFFHALAIIHTPQYRQENAGALLGDWPRIPLPATSELLYNSATLGRRIAELLDPESEACTPALWRFFGKLNLPPGMDLAESLKVTAGWGSRGQGSTVMPGRGLTQSRPWTEAEHSRLLTLDHPLNLTLDELLDILGETCLDVHLNGASFWSSIPVKVWQYTLGGHQVLKKWLSYREYELLERPVHPEEAEYYSNVVRRIVAILLLGPALDESYVDILPTATGLSAH